MSYKIREEIVGKRFLSVSGFNKVKLGKISEWCWRAGVVRASTHKDNSHKDLQILVEYDDREWQRREWVSVHKPGFFTAFLVEKTLVWCSRSETARGPLTSYAPALNFIALVGSDELASFPDLQPIEFLRDREIAFRDPSGFKTGPEFERRWANDPAVIEWIRAQDGQSILLATPSVLVGYRVQVYRAEGTTQWYTAVIVGYNEATRELTVTDDTVLEDHNEDPCLVQMRLIGDGVIESIMRGENVGITPRRSRSSNLVFHHKQSNRAKKVVKSPQKCGTKRTSVVSSGPAAAKPPAQPPDRGKRCARSLRDLNKLGKRVSPELDNKNDDEKEERRSLRSLRSQLADKREAKTRLVARVKKKEVKKEDNRTGGVVISNRRASVELSVKKESQENKKEEEETATKKGEKDDVEGPKKEQEEEDDDENKKVHRRVVTVFEKKDSSVDDDDEEVVKKENKKKRKNESSSSPPVGREDKSVKLGVVSQVSDVREVSVVEVEKVVVEKENCVDEAEARTDVVVVDDGDKCRLKEESVVKSKSGHCDKGSSRREVDSPAIDDDEGPLPASPFRMEDPVGGGLLRDDRSDSGVSSLRSAGSGDERSGSRSSALSATPPPTHRKIPEIWREGVMSQPPQGYPGGGTGPPAPLLIPPPSLYPALPPELWAAQKRHYPPHGLPPASTAGGGHLPPPPEELERAYHDSSRLIRERQREAEVRETKEREAAKERVEARERQERDRLEKQRAAEQAVHKHFEESLRLAQQKSRERNNCWINTLPGPPGSRAEEERKQQHHHQAAAAAAAAAAQHQVHAAAAAAAHHDRMLQERIRHDRERERAYFQQQQHQHQAAAAAQQQQQQQQQHQQQQQPQQVAQPPRVSLTTSTGGPKSSSQDYHPPPAHSRHKPVPEKPQQHTGLPKAEPLNFNFNFGYPRYQPSALSFLQQQQQAGKESGTLVVKQVIDRGVELMTNPSPHMTDLKNSVIVKNDKSPGLEKLHSGSPKLRTEYLPPAAKSPYEYRSPSQSPHPLSQHSPGPPHFEAQNLASISKVHVHRGQHLSPHPQRQSPHTPPHHRQSPHHRVSPHHPPSPHPMHSSPPGVVYTSKPATVGSYPYPTASVASSVHYAPPPTTPPKTGPKVSSPSPAQSYQPKVVGRPLSRSEAVPKPLTPSPYQQLSQHNLPPPHQIAGAATSGLPPPPAAHAHPPKVYSSPGLVGVPKSAGSPSSPTQTQPLDLGVGSIKEEPRSPKRKAMSPEIEATDLKKPKIEIKKEPVEDVGLGAAAAAVPPTLPMLARVSEASPLLATAATTITTVLNNSLPQGQDSSRPTTPSRPPSQEQQQQDKSAGSPRPPTAAPYPVHKLKKAWLQRHSGEDATDTSSGTIRGTGSCVTLPMPVTNPPSITAARKSPVESSGVVNSIHSIGSMAVNSIKKPKTPRKSGGAKELNGHFSSKNSTTTTPSGNGGTGGGGLAGGGGGGGAADGDDSSSSDPERTKSTQQKRVPPKVKRKKGGRKNEVKEDAKRKKTSVSSTESDKESGSEKESDTNSTGSKKKEEKGAKKRGRKPKTTPSKNGNEEESRKKVKDEERMTPQRDSIPQKPSIGHLKKTGESFLQDGPCFEVAPKLAKCRECRWTPNQRKCNMPNIFCRFYAFRRLRYTKNGQLAIAGFSDPHRDALQDDLKLWMPPSEECLPPGLDVEMSKFLLAQVGDQFCDLLLQEKEAIAVHMSDDKTIAWKRVVQGVREMCDVCETTLFNFHWACGKCGFVVCIDCYKGRKNGSIKIWGEQGRDRDDLSWLLCTNRQAHEQDRLMLTQIIAGDSLTQLGTKVHDVRNTLGQRCHCQDSTTACGGGAAAVSSDSNSNGGGEKRESLSPVPSQPPSSNNSTTSPPVSNGKIKSEGDSSDEDKDSNYSTLRELLIRPSGKSNGSRASSPVVGPIKKTTLDNLDQVISTVIEHSVAKDSEPSNNNQPGPKELKHFVRRYKRFGMFSGGASNDPALHVRIMTMTESKVLYPEVPHAWLCDGKLLRLIDATNERNYLAFQDQWKRGQPVLISDVTKSLDTSLWTPESFSEDFGDTKNDIVNCLTGNTVPNQPMRKFWDGFDCIGKRLKDERGSPMVLKLKDWPPGEDFAEMLPSRFADLMKVLPMGEYTHRTGRLNLASRLPDCFVRPDLGPKMYTAYGSASHSAAAGTTNLHLDISDAVNVMVYVGIPTDVDHDQCNKDVYRAIDEAGCDMLTRRRAREKGILPGALWHIYMARDADKIRDLLNKVELERGARLEPYHDPIHDQSWYLDVTLRERLYKEYGVEGYAIVQCQGDAVFIPAGAPHQVRNLHNCIKVAEDFVSPENVSHCFHLTQEFRELSDTHTNHEDKLQIKNIMYHAVKDSLAVLASVDPSSSAPGGAAATANSIAATTTTTGAACVDDAKKSTATSNGDGGGVPPSTNNSSNSVNNASSPLQSSVTKEEA